MHGSPLNKGTDSPCLIRPAPQSQEALQFVSMARLPAEWQLEQNIQPHRYINRASAGGSPSAGVALSSMMAFSSTACCSLSLQMRASRGAYSSAGEVRMSEHQLLQVSAAQPKSLSPCRVQKRKLMVVH